MLTLQAEVIILYHSTTVLAGYQPVIQCMTVRQSARIIQIHERFIPIHFIHFCLLLTS